MTNTLIGFQTRHEVVVGLHTLSIVVMFYKRIDTSSVLHSSSRLFCLDGSNRRRLPLDWCRCWRSRYHRRCRCLYSTWRRPCWLLTHLQEPPRHPGRRRHTQKPLPSHTLERLRSATNITPQIPTPHKATTHNPPQHTKSSCISVRNTRLRIAIPRHRIRDRTKLLHWPYTRIMRFSRLLGLCRLPQEHIADKQRSIRVVPVKQRFAQLYECRAVSVFE